MLSLRRFFSLLVSLLFKIYVARFTDYEGSYGTVGVVVLGAVLVLSLGYCHLRPARS